MNTSSFIIYNASAGSGKTFTLTKNYLKILLQSKNPETFKSILAITFTNKAVDEMKTRIINMLLHFSTINSSDQLNVMGSSICEELQIDQQQLKQKATLILKHILHNYGAFAISTIDGFTHRLIRTFAKDLKLPVNFEVELQEEKLLAETVDLLISKVGEDTLLTKIMIDFAIAKTADDKSWDLSYDFMEIAKLLNKENHANYLQDLSHKTLGDFKKFKKLITTKIKAREAEIKNVSNQALQLINNSNASFEDFLGGKRAFLPSFFQKATQGNYPNKFDAAWMQKLGDVPLYPKHKPEHIKIAIEDISSNLVDYFQTCKTAITQLYLLENIAQNIVPVSVLNALNHTLNTLKTDQRKLLISEFNQIIHHEIKKQPTPFIYERLGEKYRHFFIDEFQDTSVLQWQNLIPLIDNALASKNNSLMLVGDAKQAIYRWRGGVAEQFIHLYNQNEQPFQLTSQIDTLESNFRSAKQIVSFNNKFFSFIGQSLLNAPSYAKLFKNTNQKQEQTLEGYVNLSFLDIDSKDDKNLLYAQNTLETITKCLENGYNLKDLCVLVRKRKESVVIANYLIENQIAVTSSESLLLINSERVNFIHHFLSALVEPTDKGLMMQLLYFIADQINVEDQHGFFSQHLKAHLSTTLASLEDTGYFISLEDLLKLPLYELVETLIRQCSLDKGSDAYLQYYMDVVLEFTQKQNADLYTFVSYFEQNRDSLSIVTPKDVNAVQIMTIHKSKGLEFPVVIFPFAELDIYKELNAKIWFPLEEEHFNGFSSFLINYKKQLEILNETGKKIVETHESKKELDNINLLYVTFTRASQALFVISKKDLSSKTQQPNLKTYAGILIAFLQYTNQWSQNQLIYEFGNLEPYQTTTLDLKPKALELISTKKESHNLKIMTRSGVLWNTKQALAIERGNLIHTILSKIKTASDIDFALNDLKSRGEIATNQFIGLERTIRELVLKSDISPYFNTEDLIYNEWDILSPNSKILRPDRVNIRDNKVTIIDYKTGAVAKRHIDQLNDYESIINQMSLQVVKKILVYINEPINIMVV